MGDIAALHGVFARGETTASAVVAAAFVRIDAINPALNAFTDLDRHGAARAARDSDARVATQALRPLEGVTIGIKANLAVAGLPWTAGMALRRAIVADFDADCVARLRAAGAIIVGTLGMDEAALGASGDNPWFGRIENGRRVGYTPGGSSGGSGAAVAAGLCVAALGTDTLGSVRIPAAYNGVFGLKPTNGAARDPGLVDLAPDLDVIGPLARSLDDLAAVWDVLVGGPAAPARRVVVLADLGDVEPAVADGYAATLAALPDLPRSTLTLPDGLTAIRRAGLVAAGRALLAALGADRVARADDLSPDLRRTLDFCARATPRPDLLAATRRSVRDAIGDDGILVMPTAPQAAFVHGHAPVSQADFTALANIAGLPALSLPSGHDADGLPVGTQLVGPADGEMMLLAVARLVGQNG